MSIGKLTKQQIQDISAYRATLNCFEQKSFDALTPEQQISIMNNNQIFNKDYSLKPKTSLFDAEIKQSNDGLTVEKTVKINSQLPKEVASIKSDSKFFNSNRDLSKEPVINKISPTITEYVYDEADGRRVIKDCLSKNRHVFDETKTSKDGKIFAKEIKNYNLEGDLTKSISIEREKINEETVSISRIKMYRNNSLLTDELVKDDFFAGNGTSQKKVYDKKGKVISLIHETRIKDVGINYQLTKYNEDGTNTTIIFGPTKTQIDENTYITTNNGKSYQVELYYDNTINVGNLAAGEIEGFDISEMLKTFKSDKEKEQFKTLLKALPGDVLFDLSREIGSIGSIKDIQNNSMFINLITKGIPFGKNSGANGFYQPGTGRLFVEKESLVHELGHKMSFNNVDFTDYEKDFKNELKQFKSNGNAADDRDNYAANNSDEMLGESYELLMTGDNKSKNCILENFPETLIEAQKLFEEIRNLPK